jgi:hypothetical protein
MYSDKKILITISGYYERFQINTIESCIKRAKYPERLSFAIAYHEDHDIDTSHISNKISRYIIPQGSKTGIQKAKNILFSMILDEDFILSIDSHVIMMPDWDEELLADYEARLLRAENKKIVIAMVQSIVSNLKRTKKETLDLFKNRNFIKISFFFFLLDLV